MTQEVIVSLKRSTTPLLALALVRFQVVESLESIFGRDGGQDFGLNMGSQRCFQACRL